MTGWDLPCAPESSIGDGAGSTADGCPAENKRKRQHKLLGS